MRHFKESSIVGVPPEVLRERVERAQSVAVKTYQPACKVCGDKKGWEIETEEGTQWKRCKACPKKKAEGKPITGSVKPGVKLEKMKL